MEKQYHYETPAVVIGRHQWRMVVKDSIYGGRSTQYQWRMAGSQPWRPDTEWPSYNSSDGTYAGCPHSLRDKVWEPHRVLIEAALKGDTIGPRDLFDTNAGGAPANSAPQLPALPEPILDGTHRAFTIDHLLSMRSLELNHPDERRLLCWILPPWQRPERWSEAQKTKFIEGIFLGLGTGYYVYHGQEYSSPEGKALPMSGWLIDGQQRICALRDFFDGKLTIFGGLRWSDLDRPTQLRRFLRVSFPAIEIQYTSDEKRLMELSNRLNYGGTPHELHEMALTPAYPELAQASRLGKGE